MVVGDAAQAVLAPAIRPRSRLVMGEVVPGMSVRAVVLPDRAPLALAEIRPPVLPRNALLTRLVQSPLLGDVDDRLRLFRSHRGLELRTHETSVDGAAIVRGGVPLARHPP